MNEINKVKQILLIILLCSFTIPSQVFSQNKYIRKISISEWIEEMEQCKDKEYVLENTEIFYNERVDSLYSFKQPRHISPSDKDMKMQKNIFPRVIITNCKLPNPATCQVRHLIFQKNITFSYCVGAGQLFLYNCIFKQGLDLHQSDLGSLLFAHCSILQRVAIHEVQVNLLSFYNCSLYTDSKRVQTRQVYGFEIENQAYQFLFRIGQSEKKINAFELVNCKFLPTKVRPILYFAGGKYDIINFYGTDFSNSIVDFTGCSVKENLSIRKCKYKQPFGMHRFNFPKDNSSVHWSQLDSVGIGIYDGYGKAPYTHKTDTLISDVYTFNELNSSYRKFFSMYRTQGDIESANACYKQLKDMETRKYRYLYKLDPSTNKWFNWRFNQFLKYFSEYGTNPVQSLIISMWVILFFAGIYFFCYSDWDCINRNFLIKQHRKIMQYFRSEQRLEDFYMEDYIEDLKTFADYKKEMLESKLEIPFFIILLGKPLYLLSIIKHEISTFFYRRTEVLQGRWINLEPKRKVFVVLTVSLSLIIYLTYLGLIRALNSITLSVNSFSTLGFGAIPVKGVSRYITILEGFLGWFLLSIFSVSLISQMLQN